MYIAMGKFLDLISKYCIKNCACLKKALATRNG
jgi:hypothetical protein